MSKKIICALLAFVLLIGLMPATAIPASAAGYVDWNVMDDVLYIGGSGSIKLTGGKPGWESDKNTIRQIRMDLTGPIVIPDGAFTAAGYDSLKSVHVNKMSYWVGSTFGGVNPLFAGSRSHDLYLGDKLVTKLEIPNGTKMIPDNAFYGATIRKVTMPGSVKEIGVSAFENCYQLSSATLSEAIHTIRNNAFAGSGLTSVDLPGSLTNLGSGAFQNCKELTYVNGSSKVTGGMGSHVFQGCEKLSTVSLPANLTVIPTSTFEGCTALTNINIPSKVVQIDNNAFKNTSLKGISFPKSVKVLDGSAFDGCTKLAYVNVSSIKAWCEMSIYGTNPLNQAKYLKENGKDFSTLNIPGDVTDIPSDRFANCRNITKIVIPSSVQTVGSGAFRNCENVTEVKLGASVQNIGQNAFLGCGKIKTVSCDEKQWAERLTVESGNDFLVDAYNATHGKPSDPKDPSGTPVPVSKELANYAASMQKFYANAYEYPAGSGKYRIGYGTASIKGATITPAQAVLVLQEEDLAIAAGSVVNKIPEVASNKARREALASYTYRNGFDWLDDASHPLNKAARETVINEFTLLEAFCYGTKPGTAEFNNRLRDGKLYMSGEYVSSVPANYGYVTLNPNGGTSKGGVYVIFDKDADAIKIEDRYTPEMFNQTFLGWFTDAKTGKLVSYLNASFHGKTLYAHWQHNDAEVPGAKPVSYRLPSVMVADDCLDAATGRVRVYAEPSLASKHIQTLENNILMSIVAEYKDADGNLWVQLKNSGWVSLGKSPMGIVEPGVVELGENQKLNVYKDDNGTVVNERVASLRDGNEVSIVARRKIEDKVWGRVWFLNRENDTYQKGWIDLGHVRLTNLPEPEAPVDPDSPNGKPAIATGVVVNTDSVNVRGSASVHGKFFGKLNRGTNLNIYEYETTNGVQWALADEGWVCMQYVHLTSNEPGNGGSGSGSTGELGSADNKIPLAEGQVIGNLVLGVRSAPGAHNKKVGTLTGGTKLAIYQTKMYNGAQWGRTDGGWVCMTYIHLDKDLVIPNNGSNNKPNVLGQGRVVNCSTHVNVRANATPQSALQGTFPLGSVIELLEETTNNGFDWYRTTKGWVCGTYVQKMAAPDVVNPIVPNPGVPVIPGATASTGTITGAPTVNVREAAGTHNAKVTELRSGSRVNIKGSQVVDGATWYQIDQGWVAGKYVLLGGSSANGGQIGGTTETANGQYATGVIAQAGTKVRLGAGYGYKDVKSLKLGDKITIYEQQLSDGVAWGRISNNEWVNLAFVTLNSTGITGTGTMGTIVRAGHAVNVRATPNSNSARMATLIVGAPVEVLEVQQISATESWGRTPQGWVNMMYINLTGALPTPPLNPDANVPAPNPNPNPAPNPEKPSNQGIPFNMNGTTLVEADLQMIPGVLGDFDATIAAGQTVVISKLELVDERIWGLVEGGWIDMRLVSLNNYGVNQAAQLVWDNHNTENAIGAVNKGEFLNIQQLYIDEARKVWGRISNEGQSPRWIELTNITPLGSYSTNFLARTTTKLETAVYADKSVDSEVVMELLETGSTITISALSRDLNGEIWVKMEKGWIKLESINQNGISGVVTASELITWVDADRSAPKAVKKLGDEITFQSITLNASGVPMGFISDSLGWVELAAVKTVR